METKKEQLGITLLEILIGTAIFAFAMTLAAGIFTNIVRYQKKAEVARELDQQVRIGLGSIVSDIRNSKGLVGYSNRPYYNFIVFNRFNQIVTNHGKKLRISLTENHRRIYFQSQQGRLVVRDGVKHDDGWHYQQPQAVTGRNVEITRFDLKANHGIGQNLEREVPVSHVFPWLKIELTAVYKDPRNRKELEGEKVKIETVVTPRDFSFWY